MKKELGKWLLDIAKYVTTAGIITGWLHSVDNMDTFVIAEMFLAVMVPLGVGLVAIKSAEKEEIKRNKNKKRR